MNDMQRFNLLGSSVQFQRACAHIKKIAGVDATVLIAGETGTGKEMAARAIHYLGKRCDKPFIPVNCGALAETLLESELFGHERGAFTDAKSASPGLVSEADGGTLFLDEVDALSLKAQAALLRFLQDRTYRRVGSSVTRQADVRIIVASNADLEKMVEARQFRRDLLYRLNVLMLRMPALREREGDALELAQAFLARFSRQYRVPQKSFHPVTLSFIGNYSWPGNVRELENVVLREFLMCDDREIKLGAEAGTTTDVAVPDGYSSFKTAKALAIAEFERRYVRDMLKRSEGNLSHAARLAGQDRSAFGKLARKHGFSQAALQLHESGD
ncbi:MAG TPA: sigma-54 dependent transcriptional regulator [Noviherbaspirillum sp.]|nr:sigma-54 dependent transcriptional regulator [Noviherbaspirillum sp.]